MENRVVARQSSAGLKVLIEGFAHLVSSNEWLQQQYGLYQLDILPLDFAKLLYLVAIL